MISGGVRDDSYGDRYQVKTGPALEPPSTDSALGLVFLEDGIAPARDCLIYIKVVDNDGFPSHGESQPMSGVTGASGSWSTDIGAARVQSLNGHFTYDADGGDNLEIRAQCGSSVQGFLATDTASDSPAPSLVIPPQADLSVDKVDDPSLVNPGETLTYIITVANNGPSTSTNAVLTDALPSGVTFASSTPGLPTCAESSGTVTCSLSNLAKNATATVVIQVEVATSTTGSVSNSARVTGDMPDYFPTNNSSTAITGVPSLSQWGLVAMGGLLAAVLTWRRRRRAKRVSVS